MARPHAAPAASLHTSVAYTLLAPASDCLDALTFLAPAQLWGVFIACAVAFSIITLHRSAALRGPQLKKAMVRACLRFGGATTAIMGLVLVAARPMASLTLPDPDLLAIDFHSHTSASHDGRSGFDDASNREWHSSSGFAVAYVTDHRTFDGALLGEVRNPTVAGAGTVLLPGVELRAGDEHPILIGVDPKRMRINSPDWASAAVEADGGPAPPLLLLSLPGDILRIPASMTTGFVRVAGVEVSDGSPRGMAQSGRDHDALLALAQDLHIATVSASDNHGWGRAAPAWSVMRIPRWRSMSPHELDIAIRRTIVSEGSRAVQVIARRTAPIPRTVVGKTFSGIGVVLVMLRTMSVPDRMSWVGWTWGLYALSLGASERRRRNASAAPPGAPARLEEIAA